MPLELRREVGGWLFGCDVCQQVCPWNRRFARPTSDAAFAPRPGLNPPDLRPLLSPPTPDSIQRLRGSPLKRARRSGLARNAAVVAGNLRLDELLPSLEQVLLTDADPMLRAHAAWAVGQYRTSVARELLQQARANDTDPAVLAEIDLALAEA